MTFEIAWLYTLNEIIQCREGMLGLTDVSFTIDDIPHEFNIRKPLGRTISRMTSLTVLRLLATYRVVWLNQSLLLLLNIILQLLIELHF